MSFTNAITSAIVPNPLPLSPEMTLLEAAQRLQHQSNLGCGNRRSLSCAADCAIVVVANRPVGQISSREILAQVLAGQDLGRVKVGAVMQPVATATLAPDMGVVPLIQLLRQRGESVLAAVDDQGHLAGVLSLAHLVSCWAPAARERSSGPSDLSQQPVKTAQIPDQTLAKQVQTCNLELQKRHAELEAIYRSFPDLLFRIAADGTYLDCKTSHPEDLYTGSIEQLIGRKVLDILPDDVGRTLFAYIQKVIQTQQPDHVEYGLSMKDGSLRHFEARVIPIEDDQVLVISRNISDRKQTELALQASRERFKRLVANLPGLVHQYRVCPDGSDQFLYLSPACFDLYGVDPEAAKQNSQLLWRCVHPADLSWLKAMIAESAVTLEQIDCEYRVILPETGQIRWIQLIAQPTRQPNGDVIWDGVSFDITRRKRSEADLQASEDRFLRLAANLPGVIFRYVTCPDGSRSMRYASPRFIEFFGVGPEELYQNYDCFFQAVLPEDRDRVQATIQESALTGQPWVAEFRTASNPSHLRWVQAKAQSAPQDNGDIVWDGIILDISDRKQAEQTLWQTEERYRQVVAAMAEGVVIYNPDGLIRTCNASAEEILGLSKAEMQGLSSLDPCWQAIREDGSPFPGVDHPAMVTLRTGQPQRGVIMGVYRSDRSLRWIQINSQPLQALEAGQISGVVVSFADITQQVEAETARRQRHRQEQVMEQCSRELLQGGPEAVPRALQHLLDTTASDRIYIFERFQDDRDGLCTRQIYEVAAPGVSPEINNPRLQHFPMYQMGFGRWVEVLRQGDCINGMVATFPQAERDILESQGIVSVLVLPIVIHNEWAGFIGFDSLTARTWQASEVQLLRMAAEKLGNYLGRQQVEEALRSSESRFQRLAANLPGMVHQYLRRTDGSERFTYISDGCCYLYEVEPQAVMADPEVLWNLTNPEDILKLKAEISRSAQTLQPFNAEYRITTPTGQAKWLQAIARPERRSNGDIIWDGILIDISDRKWAEMERQRHQDLFEAVFNESADAILLADPQTRVIEQCNPRAVELFECHTVTDLIGKTGNDLVAKPYSETDLDQFLATLDKQGNSSLECEFISYQGRSFWGDVYFKRIQVLERWLTLIRIADISKRRQSEQLLREREAFLNSIYNGSASAIFVVNVEPDHTFRFVSVNPAYENLTGLPASFLAGKSPEAVLVGEAAQITLQRYTECAQYQTTMIYEESLHLQGRDAWWLTTLTPLVDEQNRVYRLIGTSLEISDRKQAEQELQQRAERDRQLSQLFFRIRRSLDINNVLQVTVTEVQQLLRVERAIVFRLPPAGEGYVMAEAVAPGWPSLLHFRSPNADLNNHQTAYAEGEVQVIADTDTDSRSVYPTEVLQKFDIQSKIVVPILAYSSSSLTARGTSELWGLLIVHACGHRRDWQPAEVTLLQQLATQIGIAIQQANLYAQLRDQLAQKEVLLKEIHHRVKNNLQVVSSLLSWRAESFTDPQLLQAFAESQDRITVMALIHEQLYQSTNLAAVNLGEYLHKLAEHVQMAYGNRRGQVKLSLETAPIALNLETAVPCGLILYELIANAFKHGFPDRGSGNIWVSLQLLQEARYRMEVADDGIGIPEHIIPDLADSMGFQLIYGLTRQIKGTLTCDRRQGTRFQLEFSELRYA